MCRRIGIWLLTAAPLIVAAPWIVIPVINVPLVGYLSDYPEYGLLIGIGLWLASILVLTTCYIKRESRQKLPRSIKAYYILCIPYVLAIVAITLLSLAFGDGPAGEAAGLIVIGILDLLSPVLVVYFWVWLALSLSTTFILIKKTRA